MKHLSALLFVFMSALLCSAATAQQHTKEDLQFIAENFDGVWFVNTSKENVRIRTESVGVSILIDESFFMRDAEVVDVNREERAITFKYEDQLYTITKVAASYIRLSGPESTFIAERSRRLAPSDNEVLDIWVNSAKSDCGMFGQFCDEAAD